MLTLHIDNHPEYKQHTLLDLSRFNIKNIDKYENIKNNECLVSSKPDNDIYYLSQPATKGTYIYLLDSLKCINMVRDYDSELARKAIDLNIFKFNHVIFGNRTEDIIYNMDPDKKYIFKPMLYARSVGKFITDKTMFVDMYGLASRKVLIKSLINIPDNDRYLDDKKEDNELFIKHFNLSLGDYRDDNEKYIVRSRLSSDTHFYMQEVVDFTHEFRILCFKGTKGKDFVVEYREGYGPLDNRMRKHVVSRLSKYMSKKLEKTILNKAEEFVNKIRHIAVSLDIYYDDKTKEYGMFEYSTQFGIDYDKKIISKIKKQYNKAFNLEIEKLTKV